MGMLILPDWAFADGDAPSADPAAHLKLGWTGGLKRGNVQFFSATTWACRWVSSACGETTCSAAPIPPWSFYVQAFPFETVPCPGSGFSSRVILFSALT
jgi:hypothetical protein